MGAAQSIRNRIVSARQADEQLGDERDRHTRAVFDAINRLPRGKSKPFGPVVIEPPTKRGGYWWILRAGEDRHGHFGYPYRSLREVIASWSLVVTGFARDKAGKFYTTEIV